MIIFKIVSILAILLQNIYAQQTQQYQIFPCRISQFTDTGQFSSCQKVSQCIDDPPPSATDKCKLYGYVSVQDQECRSFCCPDLQVQGAQPLTPDQVTQCIDDWGRRQAGYILGVIFGCVGSAAFLLVLGCLWVYGFTKNPYTGKKTWTGVLCCRKQVDFREQYEAGVTHKNLDKNLSGPMVKDPNAGP